MPTIPLPGKRRKPLKKLKIRLDSKTLAQIREITKELRLTQAQFVRFAINGFIASNRRR